MDTIRGKSPSRGTLGDCAEADTADLVPHDEFHLISQDEGHLPALGHLTRTTDIFLAPGLVLGPYDYTFTDRETEAGEA